MTQIVLAVIYAVVAIVCVVILAGVLKAVL